MSRGLNRAQIIGYLGHHPDLNRTGDGTAVVNLRIATDESYTDRDGNRQKRATWHRVTCWEGLAETVAEYLSKGSRVYVEGPMKTQSYTDSDGIEREVTKIRAQDVTFLDGRSSSGGGSQSSGRQQKQPTGSQNDGGGDQVFEPDDELPF